MIFRRPCFIKTIMPLDRRSLIKKRQPIVPAYRQRQMERSATENRATPISAAADDASSAKRLANIKASADSLRGEANLFERAIAANQRTRDAQRELNALEPLHRAATGAQRTVLDRRIKRALARMNKALQEFVVIEEAMEPDARAELHRTIDNSPIDDQRF
jgi:hypothetical protein